MKQYLIDVTRIMFGCTCGALLTTGVFFVASDYVFTPPDLNGKWYIATETTQTGHAPFKGLVVLFELILHQEGDRISGTAEQVGEIAQGKVLIYDYDKRAQVELSGSMDRNYIRDDVVNIHWKMHGRRRESSTFLRIVRFNDSYMLGTFDTTIAKGHGKTEWARAKTGFEQICVAGLEGCFECK